MTNFQKAAAEAIGTFWLAPIFGALIGGALYKALAVDTAVES
jgi:glycerol uptake facilitator-like aquaporin